MSLNNIRSRALLLALALSSPAVVGCASTPAEPPAPSSPLSTRAAEPAAPAVATSVTADPLAASPGPAATTDHPARATTAPGAGNGLQAGKGPQTGQGSAIPQATPGGSAAPASAGAEAAAKEYVCPMHPDVRQPKPGRCPRCGMDLVPAKDASVAPTGAASAASGPHAHAH